MACRIIAVANQKGGCGKTTTAVNLSYALALLHKKVLLIDLDPQANASMTMGVDISNVNTSIADILLERRLPIEECILKTENTSMDIAPATLHLNKAQKELLMTTNGEIRLRSKIQSVIKTYDFIFIDTPPSLGSLISNAMNACREVFIPIDVGYYSLIGIKELLTEIELIKDVNPDIYISGVLVTMFEHTKLSRDIYQAVVDEFGEKVFKTKIRKNVRLAEAPSHWMTIFKYAPSSFGALDYMQLAKEVIKWQ